MSKLLRDFYTEHHHEMSSGFAVKFGKLMLEVRSVEREFYICDLYWSVLEDNHDNLEAKTEHRKVILPLLDREVETWSVMDEREVLDITLWDIIDKNGSQLERAKMLKTLVNGEETDTDSIFIKRMKKC